MRQLRSPWYFAFFLFLFATDATAQEAPPFGSTPVTTHGALSVSGTKIIDQYGRAVSFAGNSFSWSNTYWGAEEFYNADVVNWLQEDWGSTILRVALGVDEVSGYLDFPEANLNRVKTVIDAAIANDMYVIIDWHSYEAHNYRPEAIAFFQQMALEYGDKPHLIYEIYNEPVHVSWADTVKPYAEAIISAIREIDPDNMIIVGTPTWSQDVDIASLDPITGFDNIAYTLHFYAATHGDALRQKAQTAINNGLPLFVTEWGTVEATADGPVDPEETDLWIDFLEQNHISHCNWSVTGKDEGATITLPGANPLGGWSEDDLSESGLIAKEIIGRWPRYVVDRSGAYPDGVPHAIPGFINPTHYDYGGLGVAYFDTTAGNFNNGVRQDEDVDASNRILGWIAEGEWVEFSVNVETAGRYFVSCEVASPIDGAFHLEFGEQNVTETIDVPSTGSWGIIDIVGSMINLEAGEQKMRVVMGAGSFNLAEIHFDFIEQDLVDPTITIESIAPTELILGTPQVPAKGRNYIKLEGTYSDDVAVDQIRVLVHDSTEDLFWNGSSWSTKWSWFAPTTGDLPASDNDWSYTLDLRVGNRYVVIAWAWDTSNNVALTETRRTTVPAATTSITDEVAPVVTIDSIDVAELNSEVSTATISGSSTDECLVDRNRLMVYNSTTKLFWDGSAWTSKWSWFSPSTDLNQWSYTLELPVASKFKVSAWSWDSSGNKTVISSKVATEN